MAGKQTVTLAFAGDEKQLTRAMERVDKTAQDMATSVSASSKKIGDAAEDGLGKLKRAADESERSSRGAHSSFSAASGGILAGAAALGAGVGAAFGGALERQDIGATLAAKLGGGTERAGELGALAGKVYADNFGESMGEVSEALQGVIGSNLVDEDATDDDIRRVTEKLLTVGQVVGESTSAVSRAVQQMLRTGLAQSAEEAFDLIVRAQQQGLNKSEDLLEVLNEYGTQFRKLGLDGPTALGLIDQGLRGGARDADIAADALKEFAIRAIDGSKASQNAFHDLGLDGEKMAAQIGKGGEAAKAGLDLVLHKVQALKDPLARNSVATGLFGTQWEDLGAALMSFDVSTASGALGDLTGATDTAAEAIGSTAGASLEGFKRTMESTLIDAVTRAAPLLEAMAGFVSQNMNVLLPLGGVIAAVTVAQWAWNAATAANPIGLIIIGIAAFIAAIVALWTHSEAFRGFFIGMWEGIRSVVGGVVDWITSAWRGLGDFFGSLPGRIGAALSGLGSVLGDAFKGALNVVIGYLNWWVERVNNIISGINDVSPFSDIPPIPHISRLHAGGSVTGGMPGEEVLRMLQVGETVSPAGSGGGTPSVRVTGTPRGLVDLIQGWFNDGTLVAESR